LTVYTSLFIATATERAHDADEDALSRLTNTVVENVPHPDDVV
jgi:hypothetical protein